MIVIPVLNARMQLALGRGMLNSLILLIALLVHIRLDVLIKLQWKIICSVRLLLNFFLVFVFIALVHFGTP